MSDKLNKYYSGSGLPPELVIHLLHFMDPETVSKCRLICTQWRNIIDDFIYADDSYWRKKSSMKFGNDYANAFMKKLKSLRNVDLYKSLSLWDDLYLAESVLTYQIIDTNISFVSFKILSNGLMGLQTHDTIKYYSSFTSKVRRRKITCRSSFERFLRYSENVHMLALLTSDNCVIGSSKKGKKVFQPRMMVKDARDFMLFGSELYIIDLSDQLHLCCLNEEGNDFDLKLVFECPQPIRCWGVKDGVFHVITSGNKVFRVKDATAAAVPLPAIDLNVYIDYGFLNNSMMSLRNAWPNYVSNLREAMSVLVYCGVVFLGSRFGTVDVHHTHREGGGGLGPVVRSFNLVPPYDQERLYPVVGIDVIEQYFGHRVFVLTPKRLHIIDLNHYFGDRDQVIQRRNQIFQDTVKSS